VTAPTHAAIAIAVAMWTGLDSTGGALLTLGALLPDLDHPQSAVGRLLLPISIPLHRVCGHRQAVHGLPLWGLVLLCGLWWPPAAYIGAGALLHVLADCWTISGVQALSPWSERVCVLWRREWRLRTGGRGEVVLLAIAALLTWAGSAVAGMGGLRALVGHVLQSPAIARQHLLAAGPERCELAARLRLPDGTIMEGTWPVLAEGMDGMAVLLPGRVVHVPRDGVLLRARLVRTGTYWRSVEVRGLARLMRPALWYDGRTWRMGQPGDLVHGYAISAEVPGVAAVTLAPPGGWRDDPLRPRDAAPSDSEPGRSVQAAQPAAGG